MRRSRKWWRLYKRTYHRFVPNGLSACGQIHIDNTSNDAAGNPVIAGQDRCSTCERVLESYGLRDL